MTTTFSRTTRSLAADGFRGTTAGLLLAAALLVGWAVWFFRAEVAVYAMSEAARLEVSEAVHPVEAPVSGRVIKNLTELGQDVVEGEILIELDSKSQQLELAEARARIEAHDRELEILREEILVEGRVLKQSRKAAKAALAEAAARKRQVEAVERYASEKAERWGNLEQKGVVTGVALLEARAEAEQTSEALDATRLGMSRILEERRTQETSQLALLDRLRREVTRLEGEIATGRSTIDRLEHEIRERVVRAPISGSLGEVATLRVGAYVNEGDRLAAVVPEGALGAVAFYAPADAVGRMRAGQRARLRLDGFPWTQFGTVPARVARVATEPQEGRIRVELRLDDSLQTSIPLEHGLPGSAEVEVERVAPATLVLRAAGKLLGPRTAAGAAVPETGR